MKTAETKTKSLELLLLDFIREYVERKAEKRTKIKPIYKDGKYFWKHENGQTWEKAPNEYREPCEKICSNAFYSLRSCKNQEDFLQYFSSSLCSVPHFLSPTNYQLIASYILDSEKSEAWKEVQALCMLSLSKLSYFSSSNNEDETTSSQEESEVEVE